MRGGDKRGRSDVDKALVVEAGPLVLLDVRLLCLPGLMPARGSKQRHPRHSVLFFLNYDHGEILIERVGGDGFILEKKHCRDAGEGC